MPLPADFPSLGEPKPNRRQPPDYTSRGTKLRLFGVLAAVMLVLAVVERGRDPRLWQGLHNLSTPPKRTIVNTARQEPQPSVKASVATPERAEMFERIGLDSDGFANVADDVPLSAVEDSLLLRMLDRLPRLGRDNLQRWRQQDADWKALTASPGEHRGEVFFLRGRAKRVEKIALTPDEAELHEFGHFYHVSAELGDSKTPAVIFAQRVPAGWPLDQPLDEPVEADGLFFKVSATDEDRHPLVFAAERVAWLPDRTALERGVGPDQLALAKLGMDIGLWDDVRKLNHLPIEPGDREAFYQVLAAVGKSQAAALLSAGDGPLEIGPLLTQSERFQGMLLPVWGTARRITRIDVADADVQARLGIDHYYEIDLFLPLGEANIRLGQGKGDAPVFRNSFPATLVVRELPPGLSESENLHEQIHADAVFFKIWTYDSRYTNRFGQVQPAPLFVAFAPHVVQSSSGSGWITNIIVGCALSGALAALATWMWLTPPHKRRLMTESSPPDFSGLA
jgi:hypothetical protein